MGSQLSARVGRGRRRRQERAADGDVSEDLMGDGDDRQEDIARFPYVEFTGKDSVTCPTCQGTGRIPKGQINELVALIHTVTRGCSHKELVVNDDGIRVVIVKFDTNNSRVFIDMTSTLNISNSNFYTVSVDTLTCQVQYMNTVIGTKQLNNVSVIPPLSEKQVNYTVRMEFSGPLAYVYTFCTMPSIKVHNIVVFMQTTVKSSYLGHPSQNSLEAYRYLDCGSNSTAYRRTAFEPLRPQQSGGDDGSKQLVILFSLTMDCSLIWVENDCRSLI